MKRYRLRINSSILCLANATYLLLQVCMDLLNSYQFVYDEMVKLMAETPNEVPWNCSEIYVFGEGDAFLQRLEWVCSWPA